MKWQARDKYHLTSDPEGYTIAIYHNKDSRDVIAWKGSVALVSRCRIKTKEQYDAAMVELKQICAEDEGK